MGHIKIDDKDTRIYVQTGMETKLVDALQNAQALSQIMGEPVGAIVNSTHGLNQSVNEYPPNAPSLKDALNEYTYRVLNAQGAKLVVSHGAGNEDAKKALQLGQSLGHQYRSLSFISLGSPLRDSVMRHSVTQLRATYLGQVNDWRDPVTQPAVWMVGLTTIAAGGLVTGVALAPTTTGTWLDAYSSALIGGGIGGTIGGSTGICGLSAYHPLKKYITKPQTQSIMFDWARKNPKPNLLP